MLFKHIKCSHLRHEDWSKKQVKKSYFIKSWQIARQILLLRLNEKLNRWLDKSSTYRELQFSDFQIWNSVQAYVFVKGFFSHNPRDI